MKNQLAQINAAFYRKLNRGRGMNFTGTYSELAENQPAAHSPAPWRQSQPYELTTGRIIKACDGTHIADVMERHANLTKEQCEANARMLAVAPEYYALSRKLVELDRQLWFDDDIATIRSLIEIAAEFSALNAKVEGRV